MKQKIKEEQSFDILKKVAKRVEEATVDISSMKSDLKMVSLRLSAVEHNTEITKVDVENLKGEINGLKGETSGLKGEINGLREETKGMEIRLGKRITYVADLITISLGKKLQKVKKRVTKVERILQA
jgi:predicted RNase H-like nuclease (RuvC/YqgF family)